jgi:DNA mismatch endonuclease (patch repair protein)
MDVFTSEKRSQIMARIRSRNTRPEEAVFSLLKLACGRRRIIRHDDTLEGTPDFVVPSLHLVVFVDSCFFHGCRKHYKCPLTRPEFWDAKIRRNSKRDAAVTRKLRSQSYSVLRLWTHDLRPSKVTDTQKRLVRLVAFQKQGRSSGNNVVCPTRGISR